MSLASHSLFSILTPFLAFTFPKANDGRQVISQ